MFTRKRIFTAGLFIFLLSLMLLPASGAYAMGQEEAFLDAVVDFERLQKDSRRGMWREPWDKLQKQFAEIEKQGHRLAAESAFYQARCRDELAERSKSSADYKEAVALYGAVQSRYPAHSLGGNALYNKAIILAGPLGSKERAVKDLNLMLAQYNESELAPAANALRAQLLGVAAEPLPPIDPRISRTSGSRAGLGSSTAPASSTSTASASAGASSASATGTAHAVTAVASANPAPGSASASSSGTDAAQEQKYKSVADKWRALSKATSANAKQSSTWLALEQEFKAVLDINPKPSSPVADKAVFQMARCRAIAATLSNSKKHWQEAERLYAQCAAIYPDSSLADDSLYQSANILHTNLAQAAAAEQGLKAQLARYPKGDMAAKAKALLKEIETAKGAAGTKPAATASTQNTTSQGAALSNNSSVSSSSAVSTMPPPEASGLSGQSGSKQATAPQGRALLRNLEWNTKNGTCTLTIEFAGKAKYRRTPITANAAKGVPAQMQFDFFDTELFSAVDKNIEVAGSAPVTAIRSMQLKPGTVRLALELGAARSIRTQVLYNPYRVKVEVSTAALRNGEDISKLGSATPKPVNIMEQLGLTVKTVVIDAGHGGKDPGAMGNGIRESEYTLALAKMLGQRLQKQGIKVLYTRETNKYLALDERTAFANSKKADIFISVHVNSSTSKHLNGVETYYLDIARSDAAELVAARENGVQKTETNDLQFILSDLTRNVKRKESKELAGFVQKTMLQHVKKGGFNVKDNGVRSAPFFVLMGAKMPAVLVEVGYLSNSADVARLKNSKYMERVADGVSTGIIGYRKKLASIKP